MFLSKAKILRQILDRLIDLAKIQYCSEKRKNFADTKTSHPRTLKIFWQIFASQNKDRNRIPKHFSPKDQSKIAEGRYLQYNNGNPPR
jgi:ribosomal protein L17